MSFRNYQSEFFTILTILTRLSSIEWCGMMAKCSVLFEVLQLSQHYLSRLRFVSCPSSNSDVLQLFRYISGLRFIHCQGVKERRLYYEDGFYYSDICCCSF